MRIMRKDKVFRTTDEVCCMMFSDDYDEAYDYIKKNCKDDADAIVEFLKKRFDMTVDKNDADEFMNLPFEKIYRCPEIRPDKTSCRGKLIVRADKRIMECSLCRSVFNLDDNYICPMCDGKLIFDESSEKFHCALCSLTISPHRFARPKDNRLINEVGDSWERVTPKGIHHYAPPLPHSDIYPNPYR